MSQCDSSSCSFVKLIRTLENFAPSLPEKCLLLFEHLGFPAYAAGRYVFFYGQMRQSCARLSWRAPLLPQVGLCVMIDRHPQDR